MMSGDCDFCDASGSVTREKLDKQKADFVVPAPIEKLELPANHAQNAKDAIKEQLRQANVGYRAQPIEIKKDALQNDGMTEAQRIAAAKAQIKPRADDMMAAQSVDSVDTSKEHVEIKPKNAQVKNDKAKQAKG